MRYANLGILGLVQIIIIAGTSLTSSIDAIVDALSASNHVGPVVYFDSFRNIRYSLAYTRVRCSRICVYPINLEAKF